MDLNRTIYIGRDDDISEVLRHLLGLAEDPREVVMQVGTREVRVSDAVAERFEGATEPAEPEQEQEPDEDADSEPEQQEGTAETPAPRKRAPRKAVAEDAPAAEETA
jgi:hypothetical protein